MQDFQQINNLTLIKPSEIEAIKEDVAVKIQDEFTKAEMLRKKEHAFMNRSPKWINQQTNPDRKVMSDISFSSLRRMAQMYPIARACINRRKTQITGLEWEITTKDEIKDEEGYKEQIEAVNAYFKRPMGHKSKMRKFLSFIVDDILTIDAICYEVARLRGGLFDTMRGLIPVDPSTILLRVDDTGAIPMPPEIAYAQSIQGHVVGTFTTEEMLYEVMNPRTFTPYGLAPLESLIIQVESAIRGALYNHNYLKENNIPEGFLTLPEEIASTREQVEEWQGYWDAIMAGDSRMTHRLKILPDGSEYTPAKKPEDMAFERFELWLLQQTCAVFDVPPQDIGITYQVNKSTGDNQAKISKEKGLLPLASFIKELFDDIIQEIMGYEDLQFIWVNVNPVDHKEEVEIAKIEIEMGAKSVDEYRMEQGLEAIGLEHYITGSTPTMVKDMISGEVYTRDIQAKADQLKLQSDQKDQKKKEEAKIVPDESKKAEMEVEDLKKWRTCVYNDLKFSRPIRTDFETDNIGTDVYSAVRKGLETVNSRSQAKLLFDEFIDPEIRASVELLHITRKMRGIEDATANE